MPNCDSKNDRNEKGIERVESVRKVIKVIGGYWELLEVILDERELSAISENLVF